MIVQHFDAMKARAVENPILAGKIYDVARVGTNGLIRDNYVVLSGGVPETLDDERFTAAPRPTSKAEFVYQTRAIGTTTAAVRALLDVLVVQYAGYSLAVPGRECSPLRVDDSLDITEERGVTPSIYYADIFWAMTSSPA